MSGLATVVNIGFDGTAYQVTAGRTILVALEEVGLRFVRGVGCRGGVCGACTVLYRLQDSHQLRAGLMCQDEVHDGMEILALPYIPQKKAIHKLQLPEGNSPEYQVLSLYPEVNNCVMCGECSRLCPVGIDVMGYVGMIKRGDLRAAAQHSFTCVQCQACVLRCPSSISQPNAALAARRFHGRYREAVADHLGKALEKLESGYYRSLFRKVRRLSAVEFQALYQRREREPDDAPPGTWLPEDRSLI
ncbi:4Fe-4S dicluster domain-containing protein [Candidatus Magnetaquicoccus inordinatus]|uniref:4Fe-4S dicluster domain-containing protein n=1 Tax=Candidatus Magnetaquicoccus inordinatus TaxID=2496818 RepID=UPI00102C013A|nr:4Fe-4S dicluster domain-containing protein [Candidatus Magnetaquicoccus inordinatus]